MRKSGAAVFMLGVLCGCAANPPTSGPFTGPVASLAMTSTARGSVAEDVFVLSAINGMSFQGMISPSQPPPDMPLNAQTGQLTSVTIPAGQPVKFTVCGESIFQAPIFSLAMTNYYLTGDISFTPVAGQNYTLKGTFSHTYSAVWIENAATGQVVAPKIEVQGAAKMPLFGGGGMHLEFAGFTPPPPPCEDD